MFALVDCNNFYASCERLFRPDLKGRAVVVLSNNDGCIVARSAEAKALGLKMAAPVFKSMELIRQHQVAVFSSNYALYGDISERVMGTLEAMAPDIEIYSIDECFVDMKGIPATQRLAFGRSMRQRVQQHVGITVGVGIAPSKTLAKLANGASKQYPQTGGVVDLSDSDRQKRLMALMPVDEVWGVGNRIAHRLSLDGIFTALDLSRQSPNKIRKFYNVVLERTVRELNAEPCLSLESITSDRKQIVCSRSFGRKVTELTELHEALVQYTSRAAEKLRKQSGVCRQLQVFIRTNPHATGMPQYRNLALCTLADYSADTRVLVRHVTDALLQIYRPGYTYLKAGVMLSDIIPLRYQQRDLFRARDQQNGYQLMQVMDKVNQSGLGEVFLASRGSNRGWQMKQAHLSPRYTTRWEDLPRVS